MNRSNFLQTNLNNFGFSTVTSVRNNCPNCHKPYFDMGESTNPISICECYKKQQKFVQMPMLMGWVCPKCNGGVAPGVDRCPCTPVPYYGGYWTTGDIIVTQ